MTPIYFVLSQAQSYSAKALKLNNSFKSWSNIAKKEEEAKT